MELVLQYTEINYRFFEQLGYYVKYSTGRICELIPYAAIGVFLHQQTILERIQGNRIYVVVFSIILLPLIMVFCYRSGELALCNGFGYHGILRCIATISIVLLFYLISFDKLPYIMRWGINDFSRYTMGIIAIHYPVKKLLDLVWFKGASLSFIEGVAHYLICFIIIKILSYIPNSFVKKVIF